MQALAKELTRAQDRATTAERVVVECLRLLTKEQFAALRETCGELDELGGFTGGG